MGIFDKARDAINQNEDKVDDIVEKAGDFIDDKTGGKFSDKIDAAQDAIEDKTGDL